MAATPLDWARGSLRTAFADWLWDVAWSYEERPTVWRLGHPDGRVLFVKAGAIGRHPGLVDEAQRLAWARPHVPVPTVVGHGAGRGWEWIELEPVAGVDASAHPLRHEPHRLVPILAHALRAFHDALPVASCPFDARVSTLLAHVRDRLDRGVVPVDNLHPEFAELGLEDAWRELVRLTPATENLVVRHGDYCFPNVMLDDHGAVTGYLDLGELGVSDRRSDVVVGAWSTTWNVGHGYEQLFYDSYGLVPTPDEERFFRLLYDLES